MATKQTIPLPQRKTMATGRRTAKREADKKLADQIATSIVQKEVAVKKEEEKRVKKEARREEEKMAFGTKSIVDHKQFGTDKMVDLVLTPNYQAICSFSLGFINHLLNHAQYSNQVAMGDIDSKLAIYYMVDYILLRMTGQTPLYHPNGAPAIFWDIVHACEPKNSNGYSFRFYLASGWDLQALLDDIVLADYGADAGVLAAESSGYKPITTVNVYTQQVGVYHFNLIMDLNTKAGLKAIKEADSVPWPVDDCSAYACCAGSPNGTVPGDSDWTIRMGTLNMHINQLAFLPVKIKSRWLAGLRCVKPADSNQNYSIVSGHYVALKAPPSAYVVDRMINNKVGRNGAMDQVRLKYFNIGNILNLADDILSSLRVDFSATPFVTSLTTLNEFKYLMHQVILYPFAAWCAVGTGAKIQGYTNEYAILFSGGMNGVPGPSAANIQMFEFIQRNLARIMPYEYSEFEREKNKKPGVQKRKGEQKSKKISKKGKIVDVKKTRVYPCPGANYDFTLTAANYYSGGAGSLTSAWNWVTGFITGSVPINSSFNSAQAAIIARYNKGAAKIQQYVDMCASMDEDDINLACVTEIHAVESTVKMFGYTSRLEVPDHIMPELSRSVCPMIFVGASTFMATTATSTDEKRFISTPALDYSAQLSSMNYPALHVLEGGGNNFVNVMSRDPKIMEKIKEMIGKKAQDYLIQAMFENPVIV